jgi:hypothetical protein
MELMLWTHLFASFVVSPCGTIVSSDETDILLGISKQESS